MSVSVDLDPFQADALRSAAEYLAGFGRLFGLVEDPRYPATDLLLVARALNELHERASAAERTA